MTNHLFVPNRFTETDTRCHCGASKDDCPAAMAARTRTEWTDRTAFAEIAEALNVPTDMIMAVHSDGIVLWTDNADVDEEPIWYARVGRGADGVMVVGPRTSTGTIGDFKARMDAAMRDVFPDGG